MALWKKQEEKKSDEQGKSEADLLIEKLGALVDEKIKPLNDGFTALKTDWESIKAEASKEPPSDPNKNPDGTEVTAEQRQANREQALFALTVTTNARITEEECIRSIADRWPQLVSEARETFAKTNWQKKAENGYPQYCKNVIHMLVGREAEKNGLRYDRGSSKFLIEDGVTHDTEDGNPLMSGEYDWTDPRNPSRHLTATQQLNKLGINPKEFDEFLKKSGQVM
jgi:hypothetical protein